MSQPSIHDFSGVGICNEFSSEQDPSNPNGITSIALPLVNFYPVHSSTLESKPLKISDISEEMESKFIDAIIGGNSSEIQSLIHEPISQEMQKEALEIAIISNDGELLSLLLNEFEVSDSLRSDLLTYAYTHDSLLCPKIIESGPISKETLTKLLAISSFRKERSDQILFLKALEVSPLIENPVHSSHLFIDHLSEISFALTIYLNNLVELRRDFAAVHEYGKVIDPGLEKFERNYSHTIILLSLMTLLKVELNSQLSQEEISIQLQQGYDQIDAVAKSKIDILTQLYIAENCKGDIYLNFVESSIKSLSSKSSIPEDFMRPYPQQISDNCVFANLEPFLNYPKSLDAVILFSGYQNHATYIVISREGSGYLGIQVNLGESSAFHLKDTIHKTVFHEPLYFSDLVSLLDFTKKLDEQRTASEDKAFVEHIYTKNTYRMGNSSGTDPVFNRIYKAFCENLKNPDRAKLSFRKSAKSLMKSLVVITPESEILLQNPKLFKAKAHVLHNTSTEKHIKLVLDADSDWLYELYKKGMLSLTTQTLILDLMRKNA
ncbi:MAG: hypothetical protein ACOYK9_05485 [Chlamydiia bacterium]